MMRQSSCQAFSVTRMGERGYMCKIGGDGFQISNDPSSRTFYGGLKFHVAPETSTAVEQTAQASITTPPQQITNISVEAITSSSSQVQASTTTTPNQETTSSSMQAKSPTPTSITSSSKNQKDCFKLYRGKLIGV
jgi:hypothetical protein